MVCFFDFVLRLSHCEYLGECWIEKGFGEMGESGAHWGGEDSKSGNLPKVLPKNRNLLTLDHSWVPE